MDLAVVITLIAAFGLLVSVHVALAVGLSLRTPRWRGVLALIIPPLAPYWGLDAGMRARSVTWLSALALYVIARIAAAF